MTPRSLGARASRPRNKKEPRGWHSRGYLPHWDYPGLVQSITFRLADSMPVEVLERWREELAILTDHRPADDPAMVELRRRIDLYEDAGHGACYLRNSRVAEIVENALLHFDGDRYRLLAWCIMPNHVHVVIFPGSAGILPAQNPGSSSEIGSPNEKFEHFAGKMPAVPGRSLSDIIHSWKSYTSLAANRHLVRAGQFWAPDYYDRAIRDEEHFNAARAYIENNPVKAGLVSYAGDWRWSSAWIGRFADEITGRAGILPAQSFAGETPALPGEKS